MYVNGVLRVFVVVCTLNQATYDRMLEDQASITREEGLDVDVPFRNLWSDHVWKNTAKVREEGVCVGGGATIVALGQGAPLLYRGEGAGRLG